jgi:deoxyhypusine synthase
VAPKPTVAPKPPVAPKPKPVVYKKISARQWKLIAKSPDSHIGERLIIHGRVTQFDAATGTDAFRADVDGIKHRPTYGFVDYPSNVVLSGDESALADLVEDDLFTARVTVTGSLTYDTQIGGQTTVPQLQIASLSVTGSVG